MDKTEIGVTNNKKSEAVNVDKEESAMFRWNVANQNSKTEGDQMKNDTEKDQSRNNAKSICQKLNEDEMTAFLLAVDYKGFWVLLFLFLVVNCFYWSLLICR